MFNKLLVSDPLAKCLKCKRDAPCIRCGIAGRPLGMFLPQGPVCNSCYPHFREPQSCSSCGKLARRIVRGAQGDGQILCHRCANSHHRTCGLCRRHRECSAAEDGSWICAKCRGQGTAYCQTCATPMAAGRGKQCEACYWHARSLLLGKQMAERLSSGRLRQSFLDYTVWASNSVDPKRLSLTIRRHVEFFLTLDKDPKNEWSSEFLLQTFGTHGLRKFELPVRWVQEAHGVELTESDKLTAAELQKAKNLLEKVPPETVAGRVLVEFFDRMTLKLKGAKVQPRSVRLAIRPAVSLLSLADPHWNTMPNQAALDKLLSQTPGQRAAVSTFLGFLKRRFGIELTSKAFPAKQATDRRKRLGEELAKMARSTERDSEYEHRWNVSALAYFHHLSLADAKKLLKVATISPSGDGHEVIAESGNYWIPKPTPG